MRQILIALMMITLIVAVGCKNKAETEMPVTADGDPILVDIGGKFQITYPYFQMALERVPILFRGQFVSPEGQREYLERLVVEAVFYIEGQRLKLFKKKEFQRTYDLRLYSGVLEEVRQELRKQFNISDEAVKEEYNQTVKKPDQMPLDKYGPAIRRKLENKALETAYEDKKKELMDQWKVKVNYDLLDRMDPSKTPTDQLPKLSDPLAEGVDYKYTVGQLLKRIDDAPDEAKKKLRANKEPKKLLELVVGEDLLFTWAVSKGLDKTPTYLLRKKMIEAAALSMVCRKEILAEDIAATPKEIKKFYEDHPKEFTLNGVLEPFEKVKEKAAGRATDEKRLEAMRSLAKSLMAHRYHTTYYQANIKKYLK